jgi:hypothetical protein
MPTINRKRTIDLDLPQEVWAFYGSMADEWLVSVDDQIRRVIVEYWRNHRRGVVTTETVTRDKTGVTRNMAEGGVCVGSVAASSGYRGVYRYGRTAWAPMIRLNGRLQRVGKRGGYADPAEAALVYDDEAIKHFGERAKLNFVAQPPEQVPKAAPAPRRRFNAAPADAHDPLTRELEELTTQISDSSLSEERFAALQKRLFEVQLQIVKRDGTDVAFVNAADDDRVELPSDDDTASNGEA